MMRGVYVHVPKTGGTSVLSMFGSSVFNLQHEPFADYRARLLASGYDADAWDAAVKFCFVRNPWARFLALYFHNFVAERERSPRPVDHRRQFTNWLHRRRALVAIKTTDYLIGNGEGLDFVGRFESFAEDLAVVAEKMQVQPGALRYENSTINSRIADWRPYYDSHSASVVERLGAWEVERFGYTFDDCEAA